MIGPEDESIALYNEIVRPDATASDAGLLCHYVFSAETMRDLDERSRHAEAHPGLVALFREEELEE
jgi:hypothetical protein